MLICSTKMFQTGKQLLFRYQHYDCWAFVCVCIALYYVCVCDHTGHGWHVYQSSEPWWWQTLLHVRSAVSLEHILIKWLVSIIMASAYCSLWLAIFVSFSEVHKNCVKSKAYVTGSIYTYLHADKPQPYKEIKLVAGCNHACTLKTDGETYEDCNAWQALHLFIGLCWQSWKGVILYGCTRHAIIQWNFLETF